MLTYQNSRSDQEMLKVIDCTLTTMQILKYSNTFQIFILSYNTKETTLLKECLTSDNESISKT